MTRTVTRQQIRDCADCTTYYWAPENAHLIGACASVGIEHGKSTGQMLFEHLAAYHFRGHETAA